MYHLRENSIRFENKNRKARNIIRRNLHRKNRLEIIEFLGGKCKKCGFSDFRALQIDHVNGGGRKELVGGYSYTSYYKKVRNNPNNYQLLCANCNWIKRYINGETRKSVI